ncbi:MAG: cyclic nucleotide-binding domain-containing protein [Spirochaetes bacterium]|nr:cyclic nucleotide-binding domain-containing protein [Spirochaetota bacterium]
MPRMINFKPNSIVYFNGDKASSVFLLKAGKVNLSYTDIQSGEEMNDVINNGEFFGVKSGLIGFPREETAKVLVNSSVIEFSTMEFEALITKNTSIIIKMLQAFSNQLRRVGKQVQSFVTNKVTSDIASDFFQIGDYYYKNKKYTQSIIVYNRYLKYYPDGKYSNLAKQRKMDAENALNSYGEGGGPTPMLGDMDNNENRAPNQPENLETDSQKVVDEDEKVFYQAVSLLGNKNYQDALLKFKLLLQSENETLKTTVQFEMGKCYYLLKRYDQCIEFYAQFIRSHSSFNKIAEVYYYIGLAYKDKEDYEKATEFLKKVLTMKNSDDNLLRKAHQILKEL